MFKWKSEAERVKYGPHEWIIRNLGHSNTMCKRCGGTPRELEVIGDMNHCERNPPSQGTTAKKEGE